MSDSLPAIVVVAYNRPHSLRRLLYSIQQAIFLDSDIQLVISIDGGGTTHEEVKKVAADFVWSHGRKEIISHSTNLGLIDHIFWCGDLSQKFGRIILLEDDLVVSPTFYDYATKSLDRYQSDPQIAGISLNALWFNGFNQYPFTPLQDSGDAYFMQIAWFQGQAYTAAQWGKFRQWSQANPQPVTAADPMHLAFTRFPQTDWFPHKTRYLVQTGRYYLFPRQSHTTNFGDQGTHFSHHTDFFQVPLLMRPNRYHFPAFRDCLAVYDSFQELLPNRLQQIAPQLADFDFVTDIYGERDQPRIPTPYVLTGQPTTVAIQKYGLIMRPPEANLMYQVAGQDLFLTAVSDLDRRKIPQLQANWQRYRYFTRYRSPSRRQRFNHWFGQKLTNFRN